MTIKLLLAVSCILLSTTSPAKQFAGSESCYACHEDQYNDFRLTGHPLILTKAEQARHRPIPLPAGYTWEDISYVIGGSHKKIRFIDKQGFIITAAKDGGELKTQYNLETGAWTFYKKGEKKPYSCGKCHTTGYKAPGHQDDMPGIKGTWEAAGVQCEACHGPGLAHTKSADKKDIMVNRTAAACGQCHIRGKAEMIPAKGGFIRHHEQYNELLASKHKTLTCVTCHNPHKRAKFSIKTDCKSCHMQQHMDYQDSTMQKLGVSCIDCHMPMAVKSATKKSSFEADVRSHLVKISTTEQPMFIHKPHKGKMKSFARDFVTTDFACLGCHKDKDTDWARKKSKNIHKAGK